MTFNMEKLVCGTFVMIFTLKKIVCASFIMGLTMESLMCATFFTTLNFAIEKVVYVTFIYLFIYAFYSIFVHSVLFNSVTLYSFHRGQFHSVSEKT